MRKYKWPVLMTAETYYPNGSKHIINRTIEGAGDARLAMVKAIENRRNSYLWAGVEFTGVTPLGQIIKLVFEPTNEITDPIIDTVDDIE